MTTMTCDSVRELLPERIHAVLPAELEGAVESHLASCEGCQEEARLLEALRSVRPEAPQGLEAAILARLQAEGPPALRGMGNPSDASGKVIPLWGRRWLGLPAWGLSAAALVVLALGTGLIWNQKGTELVQEPVELASQDGAPEAWLWDDGMVAGAPVFDGLSDEDLEALLEEMGG